MRLSLLLLPLLSVLGASGACAQAPAAPRGCVAASVDLLTEAGNQALYRIVFVNHCGAPRSLYWCAENAGVTVPPTVVCPRGSGFPAEPRHAIFNRKEFQWTLPRGSRIRFQDCGGQELPTSGFGCASP